MSRVGRFFVSTNSSPGGSSDTPKNAPRGSEFSYSDKSTRKRIKKYGMQYVPLSYPEPTIHEETSPTDGEVGIFSSAKETF